MLYYKEKLKLDKKLIKYIYKIFIKYIYIFLLLGFYSNSLNFFHFYFNIKMLKILD